ncbi:chemotaxis protein CheW [Geotalea sp. SG265]|uniref:chemotaxis protein CheW n=1 Tax=Geotalea sp. SG265 TaxID=2922867 RepID=UPI001FAF0809|nr:chemotaxis protein CheW [Geotalea sp. SG265]
MQDEKGATRSGEGEEYLTFTLGSEEYGMDILKVQEIRGYDAVTHIANSPEFLKGVINLRGVIVPIVDMRIKFNLGSAVYNDFTVVIIINLSGRVVGMVVDGVSDVLSLTPEQVKAAPEFSSGLDTRYITGLGTVNGQMLILVDIERLMSSSEMQLMDNCAEDTHTSALPMDNKSAQGEQLCNGSTI